MKDIIPIIQYVLVLSVRNIVPVSFYPIICCFYLFQLTKMSSISISVILFVLVNYSNLSQSTVFAKVTGIIKMCSGKTEMNIDVLFAQQWFSSQSSAMEAIFAPFAPSLCYGRGRNSDLNWGWQIFGRCCEVFGDLLDELSLHSWANVGHPLLQRFTTVPCLLLYDVVNKLKLQNAYAVKMWSITFNVWYLFTSGRVTILNVCSKSV